MGKHTEKVFALKSSVVSLLFICLVVLVLLFPYPTLSTKGPVWAIVVGFKGYAMYSFSMARACIHAVATTVMLMTSISLYPSSPNTISQRRS